MSIKTFNIYLLCVVLVVSSAILVSSCTGGGGGGGGGEQPTLTVHFVNSEGEPYPFDVIISNGPWRKEFTQAASIETEVPLGFCIMHVTDPEEKYLDQYIPLKISANSSQNIDVYALEIIITDPQYFYPKFSIAAENSYAKSSYSNLTQNEYTHTISVAVNTETNCDWWGYFVLPKTATVASVGASYGVSGRLLNEQEDYTITVGNYNIVCIRIDPQMVSLSLIYTTSNL